MISNMKVDPSLWARFQCQLFIFSPCLEGSHSFNSLFLSNSLTSPSHTLSHSHSRSHFSTSSLPAFIPQPLALFSFHCPPLPHLLTGHIFLCTRLAQHQFPSLTRNTHYHIQQRRNMGFFSRPLVPAHYDNEDVQINTELCPNIAIVVVGLARVSVFSSEPLLFVARHPNKDLRLDHVDHLCVQPDSFQQQFLFVCQPPFGREWPFLQLSRLFLPFSHQHQQQTNPDRSIDLQLFWEQLNAHPHTLVWLTRTLASKRTPLCACVG